MAFFSNEHKIIPTASLPSAGYLATGVATGHDNPMSHPFGESRKNYYFKKTKLHAMLPETTSPQVNAHLTFNHKTLCSKKGLKFGKEYTRAAKQASSLFPE